MKRFVSAVIAAALMVTMVVVSPVEVYAGGYNEYTSECSEFTVNGSVRNARYGEIIGAYLSELIENITFKGKFDGSEKPVAFNERRPYIATTNGKYYADADNPKIFEEGTDYLLVLIADDEPPYYYGRSQAQGEYYGFSQCILDDGGMIGLLPDDYLWHVGIDSQCLSNNGEAYPTKVVSLMMCRKIKFGPEDDPTPAPSTSKKKEKKDSDFSYAQYLAMLAANSDNEEDDTGAGLKFSSANIDRDTYKSEVPTKTVIASEMFDRKSFIDLKVHEPDSNTKFNQEFLVRCLVPGGGKQIFLTKDVYPGRDLSITENGMTQTISWGNLPKNQPGPVYAVVYNQIDGSYVLNGILDANGTATFTGFKLRPASTITICK